MNKLKDMARNMPVVRGVYRWLRHHYHALRLRGKSREQVFTEIVRRNVWGSRHSLSGTGSEEEQTRVVVRDLPALVRQFGVVSMLDIPCGDFHWMKAVELGSVDYIGADIVADVIEENNRLYSGETIRFRQLNLIEDRLPRADLVFCRDCLVHFSDADIMRSLQNVCESGAEYLLTTTFTGRTSNFDIPTGGWRALNLQLAPFNLPVPLHVINEQCTEGRGAYADKSLGLWRVRDLRAALGP
jgi:hypothetical protein